MSLLKNRLSTGHPIILDGALATYLETLGADLSGALWSASILTTSPDLIYRTHLDYFRAGADVAITASYQASVPGLQKHLDLSEDEASELIKKSVGIAKRARDQYLSEVLQPGAEKARPERGEGGGERELWIAGSVGPYGAFLADGSEYRGDYVVEKEDMKTFHRGRIRALVDAGVDILAIETIPSFAETEALVELLRDEFPDHAVWVSFTLKEEAEWSGSGNGQRISDGTPLTQIATLLNESTQVLAMGMNCVPESSALEALKVLQNVTRKPLVCYPNSGEKWDAEKRDWYGDRAGGQHLREMVEKWYEAGARLVGGCCRTTPGDIAVIREALVSRK